MGSPGAETAALVLLLDEAFEKRAWHGPNLRGSLRGVPARTAAFRPAPDRHNIWELALHAAYWKYTVRRRLTGEKRGSFPLAGSNFFTRPETMSEAAWAKDIALLVGEHQKLRASVLGLPQTALTDSALHRIRGAAMHDVYHAGQITLLKRLANAG